MVGEGKKAKVLEGYLYSCYMSDCGDFLLFPRRITIRDFAEAIRHNVDEALKKGETASFELEDLMDQIRELIHGLKRGYLPCLIITPCSTDPKRGLGPEVICLSKVGREFINKKVRITIEVLEDD